MADGISAIYTSANIPATFPVSRQSSAGAAASATQSSASTVPAQTKEDTVQLSSSAQKFLQASQSQTTQNQGLVEQLVRAAAAGDTGALSLLTVI